MRVATVREQALGQGKLSLSKHNRWDEMLLATSLSPLDTSFVSRLHAMKQSSGPLFSTDFLFFPVKTTMIATETQGPPAKRVGRVRSVSWKVAVCVNLTVASHLNIVTRTFLLHWFKSSHRLSLLCLTYLVCCYFGANCWPHSPVLWLHSKFSSHC